MNQNRIARIVIRYLFATTFVSAVALGMVLGARRLDLFKRPAPEFRTKGPVGAKLNIEEFTDFQCPACRAAHQTLKEAEKKFGPDMRLSVKHCPLVIHRWAVVAAVNAECAGRQNKFWQFADMLFDRQDAWKNSADAQSVFDGYAREAGLDMASFGACLGDQSAVNAVRADDEESMTRGVDSTPTFFVNGSKRAGARKLLEALEQYGGGR